MHDSLHCSAQLSKKDEEILAHLTEIECEELEEEEDEDYSRFSVCDSYHYTMQLSQKDKDILIHLVYTLWGGKA